MAQILKGKEPVAVLAQDLKTRVENLKQQNIAPCLAILRVGENPSDLSYERTMKKRAESLGIEVVVKAFPEDVEQFQLEQAICEINENEAIHGCLMFRPLPRSLNEQALCNMLSPEKDIDGISFDSLAGVFTNNAIGFAPSTAQACIKMLDHYGINIEGKHAVVVGRSLVIGKPVSIMLENRNATVTMCHSRTKNVEEFTRQADIVVCAVGKAHMFTKEYFTAGQTVLDVGINFEDGKLCGDVDFDGVEPLVGAITPVPGGLGSLTTQTTMEHVVIAAEKLL